MRLFRKFSELELAMVEALQIKIASKLGVIEKINDAFDNSEEHRKLINQSISDISMDLRKLIEICKK